MVVLIGIGITVYVIAAAGVVTPSTVSASLSQNRTGRQSPKFFIISRDTCDAGQLISTIIGL